MAAELRQFIQEAHPVVRERPLTRQWWGARNGRVVTRVVRSPVRPATRWMRVVSRASARTVAGRMVVSRLASMAVPAPGGPMRRT
jgi:hypothetical protein